MSRPVKRRRPLLRLVTLVVVVLVGGAAILWAKTRLFPDVAAEASSAYSRGEWDRAGALALRRLKEAPDDPRALRLAARAARKDQDQKAIAIYRRLAAEKHEAEDDFLLGRSLFRSGQVDFRTDHFLRVREQAPMETRGHAAH